MESLLSAKGWEDLKKQARYLENELDVKLVSFSKLANSLKYNHPNLVSLTHLDEEHVFKNMASEIELLLTKLILINDKVSEINPDGAAMLHTMQRHKEILKDYEFEFNKIRNNFVNKKNREDLLDGLVNEKNYNNMNGLNRRDMYMKENQHIQNSNKLINEQINIAMDTRDNLQSQRKTFKRIQTRFINVSTAFPTINSLLQRTNLRKHRDTVILGCLIAFCTILIFLYSVH